MIDHVSYSIEDWNKILSPYGYVDITTHSAATFGPDSPSLIRVRFSIALKERDDCILLDEWDRRMALMATAQSAVNAVRDTGFKLEDPPRIEFGGNYYFRLGRREPRWHAEANLTFEVYP
jgi:hypothetical protein